LPLRLQDPHGVLGSEIVDAGRIYHCPQRDPPSAAAISREAPIPTSDDCEDFAIRRLHFSYALIVSLRDIQIACRIRCHAPRSAHLRDDRLISIAREAAGCRSGNRHDRPWRHVNLNSSHPRVVVVGHIEVLVSNMQLRRTIELRLSRIRLIAIEARRSRSGYQLNGSRRLHHAPNLVRVLLRDIDIAGRRIHGDTGHSTKCLLQRCRRTRASAGNGRQNATRHFPDPRIAEIGYIQTVVRPNRHLIQRAQLSGSQSAIHIARRIHDTGNRADIAG